MKPFSKALKFASFFSLSIIGVAVITNITQVGFQKTILSFKEIGLYTSLLFFTSAFLAAFTYYKCQLKKSSYKLIIISITMLFTFGLIYILMFFNLSLWKNMDIPFFQTVSLFNGIIALFIYLFVYLFLFLKQQVKNSTIKNQKVSFFNTNIFTIWILSTITYLFIFISFSGRYDSTMAIYTVSMGLVALMVNYFTLYNPKLKTPLSLSLCYFINVIAIPILSYTAITYNNFNLDKTIKSVIVFGPYFLFLTLFIHIYHAYQVNKKEKLALKNKNISTTLKHQHLKNQINPHFLFNNISVLTSLIEESPKKAVHFSESLASIYRYILKQDKYDTIPLKQDLEFINEYITLLKYRFENAINFYTKIEHSNEHHLPTMALQQVLENVVKHNQISSEKPITISITTVEDYLIICNNCNSKNKENSLEKTGIKNLTERYSYLTDSKINITHTSTEYCIKLPLLTLSIK